MIRLVALSLYLWLTAYPAAAQSSATSSNTNRFLPVTNPSHDGDGFSTNHPLGPTLMPQYLRCEYLQEPLGIETRYGLPRFFWIVTSTNRAQRQLAYQILVASTQGLLASDQGDVWDSGKVFSELTTHVEYKGTKLHSAQPLWWKVRAWDVQTGKASPWSTNAFFQTGLLKADDWDGVNWIGPAGYDRTLPCPVFRSPPLVLDKPIARATAFVSAKGVYELWVNGQRAGKNILAPEWTDYRKTIQYQSYDLTPYLFSGKHSSTNIIGAFASEGWFSDTNSFVEITSPPPYGAPCPQLAVLIEILNLDGTSTRFTSSTDWTCSTNGPIRKASIYNGELYDANQEGSATNWTWPNQHMLTFTNPLSSSNVLASQMVSQPNEPIQLTQILHPVDVWNATNELGLPAKVYDLGQNMVGWCKVSLDGLSGTRGATLRLRHAERLKLDGTNGVPVHGNIDVHNLDYSLGAAQQTDTYILSDDPHQEFHPHFTYHGFRYVEATLPPAITESNIHVTGCVIQSGSPATGSFRCSNPQVTRLMNNIQWTIRGNLYGVMTDAPQRPEREGYLGSEMLIAQTACFDFDLAAFYTKWIRDIRAAQEPSGAYPIYAPWNGNRYSGWDPGWQVGGIWFPWQMYLNYGDTRMLEEHYASTTKWVRYLSSACPAPDYVWRSLRFPVPPVGGNNISYGDWLNGDAFFHYPAGWPSGTAHASMTNLQGYGTAWAAHSADLAAAMSALLQKKAAARDDLRESGFYATNAVYFSSLARKLRSAFTNTANGFVTYDLQGKVVSVDNNSQGACVDALYFNMLPEAQRPEVAKQMVYGPNGVQNYNTNFSLSSTNHLSTGNQFAAREMLELSRNGYSWQAFEVLTNSGFPSWLYWVENGATTCWERWNSYLSGPGPGRGYADYNEPRRYGDRMSFNSFNSLPFGAVGEWLWKVVGGINPDSERPGFANILFWPQAGGGITWCSNSLNTIRGLVSCAWTNDAGRTNASVEVTIPANTTGTLFLPTTNLACISEQGLPIEGARGVLAFFPTNLPNWGASEVVQLGSGNYRFDISGATFLVRKSAYTPPMLVQRGVPPSAHSFNGLRFSVSMAILAGVMALLMRQNLSPR